MSLSIKKVNTFNRRVEVVIPTDDDKKPERHEIDVTFRLGVREQGTLTDAEYLPLLVERIEGIADAQGAEAIELAAMHDSVRPAIVLKYFEALSENTQAKNSRKSR